MDDLIVMWYKPWLNAQDINRIVSRNMLDNRFRCKYTD